MVKTVAKRDGQSVPFDAARIKIAIEKAAQAANKTINERDLNLMVNVVVGRLEDNTSVTVEEIQNTVEDVLIFSGLANVAKHYIRYRQTHADRRLVEEKLMGAYTDLLFKDPQEMDLKRDNANINTDAPMGIMLKLGTEGAKYWALSEYGMPQKYAEAHKSHIMHFHDLDFSYITLNCLQQDLGKTLKGGFNTGHGFLREPNSIRSAASLACISIQSSQNDMFGGQSINALDYALAPYVAKSFKKAYRENVAKLMSLFIDKQAALDLLKAIEFDAKYDYCNSAKNADLIKEWAKNYEEDLTRWPSFRAVAATAWENACEDVEEETKQAMEAMIHNFNSLHSRAGQMRA